MRPFTNRIRLAEMRVVREAVAAALPEAAEMILSDSNRRVPEDTGDLKRSGKVVQINPDKVAVTYTDGGAVAAHEKLNVPPGNGRERKYLESAFNSERDAVFAHIVAAAKRSIGR